jgi:hypothetical protein
MPLSTDFGNANSSTRELRRTKADGFALSAAARLTSNLRDRNKCFMQVRRISVIAPGW